MVDRIRVLVVDDSAFVRKVVTTMLSRSPDLDVIGTARNGADALDMVQKFNPDVITLDLVMPEMDGVAFLREQMKRRPVPVVVCSIAHDSGELAMAAFDAGAVDFVQKPTALANDRVYEIGDELIEKVKAAAAVEMRRIVPARAPVRTRAEHLLPEPVRRTKQADIVVIGISTGGPQALRLLIPGFPADFPVPIALVLHMPIGYTEMYANRLNEISALNVVQASSGDAVEPGAVLVAPAGQHLSFQRERDGSVRCHLDVRPLESLHRPSVDVLFQSAAETYGPGVLGVIMTGMGNDGLLGAAHVKAQGGRIVTEAESSCVVYGMPRSVEEAALSDLVAPLDKLTDTIMEMV